MTERVDTAWIRAIAADVEEQVSGYAYDALLAAADEMDALRPATEWRPISTAPRDGTRVLVWSDADGAWPAEWRPAGDYGPGWYPSAGDGTGGDWGITDATHWQPLPTRPDPAP